MQILDIPKIIVTNHKDVSNVPVNTQLKIVVNQMTYLQNVVTVVNPAPQVIEAV